ncbi:SDR family NAD(P)-dependent oxidoreductase [Rhizorhabdus sp.]|uniref:SDR family NAD(P)-dependent oxidoreductase n=1 Tax=Rhizorhabdus sp. TaxID=1968843 RepID=UPI0035B49060
MKDFKGRVAVITGAANGIGRALAEQLAAEGARLALMDIEADTLETLRAELSGRGADVFARAFDIGDFEASEAFARDVLSHFGTVNLVIANAGVTTVGRPAVTLSINDWRWVLGTNLFGVIHAIQPFLPTLMGQEGSHIAITASGVCSFTGVALNGPYCASKAAAISYAETLYRELAAANPPVGVTAICPGTTLATFQRSEERRPAHLPDLAETDPIPPVFREMLAKIRADGLTSDEVARQSIEAIRENRFYVITHPENGHIAAARGNDAAAARNPSIGLPGS